MGGDTDATDPGGADARENLTVTLTSVPALPLTVTLTAAEGWPGESGELRCDPAAMREVARVLGTTREQVEGVRGILDGAQPRFGPASWVQARYLQQATDDLTRAVGDHLAQLSQHLQDTESAVTDAAGRYESAEHDSTHTVTSLAAQIPAAQIPAAPTTPAAAAHAAATGHASASGHLTPTPVAESSPLAGVVIGSWKDK